MKHCIIVKFKNKKIVNEIIEDVKKIFNKTLEIDGIHKVDIYTNCVDRANRYDLMIVIEMDREVLDTYDKCLPHHEWKEKYSSLIESKAIFDY